MVDLELLGLMTDWGAVDCLVGAEELMGIADLVVFMEAGDLEDIVGIESPVDARDILDFEGLRGGEGMVGTKGLLILEVTVAVKDLVAVDRDLIAFHRATA